MASLHSPPLDSSKRVMGLPAVSFTTVEDDPNVPPVLQLPTQLLVAAQMGTAHDKDEHAYVLARRSFEIIDPTPDRSVIGSLDPPGPRATAGRPVRASSGNDRLELRQLSPSFSRMVEEPLNGRDKVFQLDWLALVRIEPGVRDPLPILGHHRRGHSHDGNSSSGLLGSQLSERLDPVDPGEPNVHQDQARMSLLGEADALFPRFGLDDRVALERQHVPDELAVLVVVLHDKDQLTRHDAPGS